jgi:GH24 family phage-related lysozyme (muramidase)
MEHPVNKITYQVALEVASHEAIVRQAYRDSVNVWTWSVGLTSATSHDVTRYIGKPQTMEHCLRIYVWALDRYAEAVRKAFAGTTLTEAQFAAALSFHWNTGSIGKASWVAAFKRGDMAAAEKAFLSWNKPPEIKGRRQAEADLLFRGKWSNNGTINEYTRVNANGTPVWSSAKRVNIEADLRAALGEGAAPPEPLPPSDDREEIAALIYGIETRLASLKALIGA